MTPPLTGRTVVVTRAAEQASGLGDGLRRLGATVVEVPVIAVVPPTDGGADLRGAMARLRAGDWVGVTSANGVAAVVAALAGAPLPSGVRTAAVGPATAAALEAAGMAPTVVPTEAVAEALATALTHASPGPGRIVLAQAEAARAVLADALRAAGWAVTAVVAYRTAFVPAPAAALARAAEADAITFTSGSTVEAYLAGAPSPPLPPVVVCIGPVTADAARRHGLSVTAVADPHTTAGLLDAVARALGPRTGR